VNNPFVLSLVDDDKVTTKLVIDAPAALSTLQTLLCTMYTDSIISFLNISASACDSKSCFNKVSYPTAANPTSKRSTDQKFDTDSKFGRQKIRQANSSTDK
jgi:hypothetical protein